MTSKYSRGDYTSIILTQEEKLALSEPIPSLLQDNLGMSVERIEGMRGFYIRSLFPARLKRECLAKGWIAYENHDYMGHRGYWLIPPSSAPQFSSHKSPELYSSISDYLLDNGWTLDEGGFIHGKKFLPAEKIAGHTPRSIAEAIEKGLLVQEASLPF